MIDILSVQTFPIAPSIEKLSHENLKLKIFKDELSKENTILRKTLVFIVISIGVYASIKLVKKVKKENKK